MMDRIQAAQAIAHTPPNNDPISVGRIEFFFFPLLGLKDLPPAASKEKRPPASISGTDLLSSGGVICAAFFFGSGFGPIPENGGRCLLGFLFAAFFTSLLVPPLRFVELDAAPAGFFSCLYASLTCSKAHASPPWSGWYFWALLRYAFLFAGVKQFLQRPIPCKGSFFKIPNEATAVRKEVGVKNNKKF